MPGVLQLQQLFAELGLAATPRPAGEGGEERTAYATRDGLALAEVQAAGEQLVGVDLVTALPRDRADIVERNHLLLTVVLGTLLPEWQAGGAWLRGALERLARPRSRHSSAQDHAVQITVQGLTLSLNWAPESSLLTTRVRYANAQ